MRFQARPYSDSRGRCAAGRSPAAAIGPQILDADRPRIAPGGGAERRWHRAVAMSAERHRAPEILADSSLGCTEANLLAHGFTTDLLVDLVHEGLATATPETVHAGKRPIKVVRVRITDAGRLALAG